MLWVVLTPWWGYDTANSAEPTLAPEKKVFHTKSEIPDHKMNT